MGVEGQAIVDVVSVAGFAFAIGNSDVVAVAGEVALGDVGLGLNFTDAGGAVVSDVDARAPSRVFDYFNLHDAGAGFFACG